MSEVAPTLPSLPPGTPELPDKYRAALVPPNVENSGWPMAPEFTDTPQASAYEVAATTPEVPSGYEPKHLRIEESLPALTGLRKLVLSIRHNRAERKLSQLQEDIRVNEHVASSIKRGEGYLKQGDRLRPKTHRQKKVAARLERRAEKESLRRLHSDHLRRSYGEDVGTKAQRDRLKKQQITRKEKRAESGLTTRTSYGWSEFWRKRNRGKINGHLDEQDHYIEGGIPFNRTPSPKHDKPSRDRKRVHEAQNLGTRSWLAAEQHEQKSQRRRRDRAARGYKPRHART